MKKILVDARDYIYIHNDYVYKDIWYWVQIFVLFFIYSCGFFLYYILLFNNGLTAFMTYKTSNYSVLSGAKLFITCLPAITGVLLFQNLVDKYPLPEKEDISSKVFKSKLLNYFIFITPGFVLLSTAGYFYIKLRY